MSTPRERQIDRYLNSDPPADPGTAVFIGGRQSGKTSRMMDWLLEGTATQGIWDRVLICATAEDRDRIVQLLRAKGAPDAAKRAVRMAGAPRVGGRTVAKVGVDDAERVLSALLAPYGGSIDAITLTGTPI